MHPLPRPRDMTTPSSNGFMVLHSNRLEGLRELMVAYMQRNPLPPLAPEVLLYGRGWDDVL